VHLAPGIPERPAKPAHRRAAPMPTRPKQHSGPSG
jgi:hypothetical protein